MYKRHRKMYKRIVLQEQVLANDTLKSLKTQSFLGVYSSSNETSRIAMLSVNLMLSIQQLLPLGALQRDHGTSRRTLLAAATGGEHW